MTQEMRDRFFRADTGMIDAEKMAEALEKAEGELADIRRVHDWCMEKPHDREVKFRYFEGPGKCWQAERGRNVGPRDSFYATAPSLAELGRLLADEEALDAKAKYWRDWSEDVRRRAATSGW